jgi:hypothetical protein
MIWSCQLIWLMRPAVSYDNKWTEIKKNKSFGAVNELQTKNHDLVLLMDIILDKTHDLMLLTALQQFRFGREQKTSAP